MHTLRVPSEASGPGTATLLESELDLRGAFPPAPGYLNSATYGLTPLVARDAFLEATGQWAAGTYAPTDSDAMVARGRAAFARLNRVGPDRVAVGHQASPMVGIIAASLPRAARVLVPEGDFTSLLFPFLAQEQRGVEVHAVELDDLAEAIDGRTDFVAFSAVQSADGRVADLDAIVSAAAHHGARTLCDTTQACGWLPIDATCFDVTVCSAYKWLLNPRGTAFMTVTEELESELIAHSAGWYATDAPWENCYGTPLREAAGARRFDVSPAWLNWHAAAPALELLADVGVERIHAHDVGLANRFRTGMELEPNDSAIVSLPVDHTAAERLAAAGITTSVRAGRLRLSFHLHNVTDDVDAALHALTCPT